MALLRCLLWRIGVHSYVCQTRVGCDEGTGHLLDYLAGCCSASCLVWWWGDGVLPGLPQTVFVFDVRRDLEPGTVL